MLKIFIDRPILSAVISILIVFLGIIGINTLPIERYPNIATPTVTITAAYTGANAETVQKSVLVSLEEAINGVENMLYMTSEATNNGSATIRVYFKQGTDPDMATVNVQNRVSKVTAQLPSDVTRGGVSVSKQQASIVAVFTLYSSDDKFDQDFVSNYTRINLLPQVLRINGVGGVSVLGSEYSIRVWLKPDVMAQYSLKPSDITTAIGEQSIESPTGILGDNSGNTFQYTMKYRGRFETPEEYENIIIRSLPDGEILRLKDVATVELGALNYAMNVQSNGHPGTVLTIQQSAGSNATEISQALDKLLDEVVPNLPPGMEVKKLLDVNDFLDASIKNIVITLLLAILLVIIVVYVFLQSIRSTLIPLVSIVVSILGTFGILSLLGFSINLLTLFALVLAIGSVVDDAIIVVEAVQTKFDEGYRSSYKAAVDGMSNITGAIITSTLVFMAVFIPVSFMGGTSGVFFTQFGLTMAAAIALSAINALTLSPALCSLLMKPDKKANGGKTFEQRFRTAFNASFSAITNKYKGGVRFFVRYKWITGTILVGAIALLVVLMSTTKSGFIPQEDQGLLYVNVATAPGNTLQQTEEIVGKVEKMLKDIPQIESYAKISGFSQISGQSASAGTFIMSLKPWSERKGEENSIDAVTAKIKHLITPITDAKIFMFSLPMVLGYGSASGVELYLQDKKGSSVSDFFAVSQNYIGELNKRPEIAMAYTSFNTNFPQYMVDVDADKCSSVGISPKEVLAVLSGYCGGQYVTDLNRFSKVYRVMIQAAPEDHLNEQSLHNIYVRTSGGMAPVSQFVTLTRTYGSESLTRFNMFNSISVNVRIAEGYSSGDAINAVRETANAFMPTGYGYEFGGMTREESGLSNNMVVIFAVCLIFIYLILCALYESFLIPLAVIVSVPVGLMGSFLFTKIMGLENNIYLQMGIIMLIGLLAKTAILITEYAGQARKQGMSIPRAALNAATVRLRPILMTALTMIVGLLPLLFSTGVGANGDISLGVGAVGGMFVGTLALLFITPALFMLMQQLQEKLAPQKRSQEEENN